MMKVFTITTQYANNMGALLQCYALSKYLNSADNVECEVLQYFPEGYNRSWTSFHKPRTLRDVIKMVYEFLRFDLQIARKRKKAKMRLFIKEYIPLSKKTYKRNDIIAYPPAADVFIVGSDQIWNFKLRKDMTYFLDFVSDDTKKISYAASVADDWCQEDIDMIKPILSRFNKISIRERGNLPCVNAALKEKEATVVCDPVFLLSREQWDEVKVTPDIKEPYIFCYFLSVTPFAVETVRKIRNLTGYKVVHLNLNALDKFNSDIVIKDADPKDFIGLISNASYVCTNSFHCSAFSIIYKRNLTFVPKHMANERVVQLEKAFGIDVIINQNKLRSLTKESLITDYSKPESGEEFIEYSKDFLLNSLSK